MVAGAADLMTGVASMPQHARCGRHTGTPRGSIGHHFPRGKQQLIEDALVFAGKQVSGPLRHLTEQHGAISGFAPSSPCGVERWSGQISRRLSACSRSQSSSMSTMRRRRRRPDEAAQKRLLDLAEGCSPTGKPS